MAPLGNANGGDIKELSFQVDQLFDTSTANNWSYNYRTDAQSMFNQWAEHKVTKVVYRLKPRITNRVYNINNSTTGTGQGKPPYFGEVMSSVPPIPIDFAHTSLAAYGREQFMMQTSCRRRPTFRTFSIGVRPKVVELRTILNTTDGSLTNTDSFKPVPYGWQANNQRYGTVIVYPRTAFCYVWTDSSQDMNLIQQMDQYWDVTADIYMSFRGRRSTNDAVN